MIALYDASVLYSGMVRDLLMRFALADLLQAKWTDNIHEEWINALLSKRPDLPLANHQRVRWLMDRALPDALVSGYESLIAKLDLPDKDDNHVLAAAIHAKASVIVSFNLKDFPASKLEPHGLIAQDPDTFACLLLEAFPERVAQVVETQHQSLKHPPKTIEEMLIDFKQRGLERFALALEDFLP